MSLDSTDSWAVPSGDYTAHGMTVDMLDVQPVLERTPHYTHEGVSGRGRMRALQENHWTFSPDVVSYVLIA